MRQGQRQGLALLAVVNTVDAQVKKYYFVTVMGVLLYP